MLGVKMRDKKRNKVSEVGIFAKSLVSFHQFEENKSLFREYVFPVANLER